MNIIYSLVVVAALISLAAIGAQIEGLRPVFVMIIPYLAVLLFLGGFVWKIWQWARTPVPFRIPTTCGQQKSHEWIEHDSLDNPPDTAGVIARMALEILLFRSLFRNTAADLQQGRLTYGATKWLWAAGLAFHWCFLIILIRHLRFFTNPVPSLVNYLSAVDGLFQVGLPVFYATSVIFLCAVTYLFLRRVVIPQVRYISLLQDYFPLFLIISIAGSGILLRHVVRADIVAVKSMTMALVSFQSPQVPDSMHYLFYVHIFLVCVLFGYFPFSKLMHAPGVFLSPTRNLANNNRFVHHHNPWGTKAKIHKYADYEKEFHDKMVTAGIPLDSDSAAGEED